MRLIKLCAECGYYDWKKHGCAIGATDPGEARDPFYKDCPLPEGIVVVHGHFNYFGGRLVCSECGGTTALQYMSPPHYCPNCGAKMDGGAKNDDP